MVKMASDWSQIEVNLNFNSKNVLGSTLLVHAKLLMM